MLNKKIPYFIFMLISTLFINQECDAQRCRMEFSGEKGKINLPKTFASRSKYSFQLVFHILYSKPEENIGTSQILSQLEILNEIYNREVIDNDLNIPEEFRKLKTNPCIAFCLAEKNPLGQPTNGITRKQISDISIACKEEFQKKSIMHASLGGVDVWNPNQYINVYVVNSRDQCDFLGRTIYPWEATNTEDGIILDYRAIGFIGTASSNYPFNQGKTLVHEMGHYFGLLHLDGDTTTLDCSVDDLVSDTPPQSDSYLGCPAYPKKQCGNTSMTMNYMNLVDDACMKLFTKEQVKRMHQVIQQYKSELLINPCIQKPNASIDSLYWIYNEGSWQIKRTDGLPWEGQLELIDISGRLLWKGNNHKSSTISLPNPELRLPAGVYFLRISHENKNVVFKLIKYHYNEF